MYRHRRPRRTHVKNNHWKTAATAVKGSLKKRQSGPSECPTSGGEGEGSEDISRGSRRVYRSRGFGVRLGIYLLATYLVPGKCVGYNILGELYICKPDGRNTRTYHNDKMSTAATSRETRPKASRNYSYGRMLIILIG